MSSHACYDRPLAFGLVRVQSYGSSKRLSKVSGTNYERYRRQSVSTLEGGELVSESLTFC